MLFCIRLYKMQLDEGRYFLHEHPRTARSWQEKCMQSIINHPLVVRTEIDQCAYGLRSRDSQGEAPAKKPTSFLTNSAGLRDAVGKRCSGFCRHVQLVDGRASAAQIYPQELCRAVTRGIFYQARMDVQDLFSLTCGEEMPEDVVSIGNTEHDEDGQDG